MLADFQTYSKCTHDFIKISRAALEEFGDKNDTRILYSRWMIKTLERTNLTPYEKTSNFLSQTDK